MARDLTQGSILKNLLIMSIPTMIGYSAQMVYDIVDIFWIGRISGESIAGVTIFSTLFWLVEILNSIIGQSSISLISQSYGRKDDEGTAKAIEQTITFKFLVAVIAAVLVALFLKPSLSLFSNDPNVITAALDYGYIRLFFLPMMFSSYSVNTALRCIGDAKTPMYIMMLSSILNVLLDPLLMFDKFPELRYRASEWACSERQWRLSYPRWWPLYSASTSSSLE
jgi:Na+-driven multidrug efflux pump